MKQLIKKFTPALSIKIRFSVLMLGAIFFMQACFPYGPEDIEEFDIVATFFEKDINFASYKTYAMPDTVAHLNSDGSIDETVITGEYDALVLSQVAANMSALGYSRVEDPETADLIMTVAAVRAGYNMDTEYDYGDYYGPGYDYGSGSYAGGSGYELETGTVIINLADLKLAGSDSPKPIWLGLINGIVEESYTNTSRRLIELVNRCFAQSPYLGTSSN